MSRRLAVAAAAASGVLVGSAMVATRYVVDQTGPGSLALMRYAIGFLCLAPAMLASGQAMRFARGDVLPIAILGITQFGILIALLNFGLRFIPSARGALIFASMPLITMVIGAALGREPLTATKTLGVLLTILGVGITQFGILIALLNIGLRYIPSARGALIFAAMPLITMVIGAALGREPLTLPKTIGVLLTIAGVGITLGEKAIEPGAGIWWGELAVLGSAICGALCSVLYRPYLQRYPTLAVSSFAMLASVGFLALVAAGEGFFVAWPAITLSGWGAVIFIGLNSGVGYFLWLYALRHASPTRVTVFLSLSPVTASILGALLLSEAATAASLVGLAAVVIGIWIAHR